MKARRWWRVEWTGRHGQPCAASSSDGPNDAKARAARFFDTYPADTQYRLMEYTETAECMEIFTANAQAHVPTGAKRKEVT